MNIYKNLFYLFQILDLIIINSASIQLYNTEDVSAIQSYDCIYYTNVTANNNETTPYCIRTNESVLLDRSFTTNTCENAGKEWSFSQLKEMNVSQDEVLTWNSSIEMADRYAAYLTTGHEQFANNRICNCSSNTFGKFCEYEFITGNTFEDAIQYQFNLKLKYRNGSQLWGNITCYTTLSNCDFGLRCLTWHNICDQKQQCIDGIDEEYCEELEYNECEENEYRCRDGSCISEYYWLDGQYDCSDKSDEQYIERSFPSLSFCPLVSSQFICDETTPLPNYFSCGDGQFRTDRLSDIIHCYNYRNMVFFCEFLAYETTEGKLTLWTLENGHCVDNGVIQKNLTDMDELEKCVFYLKCKLTNGTAIGCNDVISLFYSLCQNKTINYPSGPLLKPYVQTVYQLSKLQSSRTPNYVFLNGSIKCIGHQARFVPDIRRLEWSNFMEYYNYDTRFCRYAEKVEVSGPQIDKNCWNDTKQSFLCQEDLRCISKHRLRDGISDCSNDEDEDDSQRCYMTDNHRLNCSAESSLCLLVSEIGYGPPHCYAAVDKYIPELKWNLGDQLCTKHNSIECNLLKTYIQLPSSLSTIANSKVLLFRQYCDTVWHLSRGFDESLCNQWKCPQDQYQCLSGHCTPVVNVIYNFFVKWDCPDATDNIGLLGITQLSEHNVRLLKNSLLEQIKERLIDSTDFIYPVAFSALCNKSQEYGCILASVTDPLNFTINRPCINVKQIGDGVTDCYGGLDERNLLTCGNNVHEQRGFNFHCSDQECIPYHRLCEQRCSNNADKLLCDELYRLWDPSCQYPTRNGLCQFFLDDSYSCDLFRAKRYYCDITRPPLYAISFIPYRLEAWGKVETWIDLPDYPILKDIVPYHYAEPPQLETITVYSHIPYKQENDGQEGWICGRGVAIRKNKTNTVQCFCPPSLYGEYCQYFSDRITVITSLHNIPSQLLEQQTHTIKVLVLLLSNDDIIDHHVFHLPLMLSKELDKKFRFNLIHRRPKLLSNSYIVRFEAYQLSFESSITFLAVWEYSIHFPFLPSYRLAQILKFDETQTSTNKSHICQVANPCLHNSTCHSITNQMNNMSAYYCHCNNQTLGKHCQHLLQPTSSPICSKHALLRPLLPLKSICLCPIHSYGPTCHLNHTCLNNNPCDINRGKCYVNPDNITHDYICVCDKKFFGDCCQFDSAMVKINFTDFSFVQIPSNFILSTVIQLCDLHNETLDLIIHQKRVYQGLPPSITDIYHNNYHLPILGIMKLYHKQDLSNDYVANLKQPDYFILYSISPNVSRMNLTLEMNMSNYCPYTPTIFHQNVSNASHLFQFFISNQVNSHNQSNVSTIIFKYHLLCDKPYSLICFHDDIYFCLCDKSNHAECSQYNLTLDECHGRCRANGQCIHGDLDDRRDFVCLCPRCYHGSICQHNTELFSFTLETLLTNDLYSPSLVIQRLFFSLLIIIPTILFLIGAINNICCYVTFNRPKPLLVGIGHYLRTTSIINQLTLFMLLLKLLHLVLSIKGYIVHPLLNTILCKMLSYLLACTTRMSYWLTGMVAIERVYVTWYIKGTWLKSPRVAKCIIATIIIGIVACDVHEPIYYQSIEDPKSIDMNNSTWCVTSYSSAITIYNQVNIILNYILPFLINFLSTITLIILITRRRAAATLKKREQTTQEINTQSKFRTYIILFSENKDLLLAPLVTMLPQLFFMPQFILSFSLACQEFTVNWHRYLLISSYFITYLPQVFSYKLYVSPSSFFMEEFRATKLHRTISEWRALISRR